MLTGKRKNDKRAGIGGRVIRAAEGGVEPARGGLVEHGGTAEEGGVVPHKLAVCHSDRRGDGPSDRVGTEQLVRDARVGREKLAVELEGPAVEHVRRRGAAVAGSDGTAAADEAAWSLTLNSGTRRLRRSTAEREDDTSAARSGGR